MLRQVYPEASDGRIRQHSGQIWSFAKRIDVGDWFVVPSKQGPTVHIGEITSEYRFLADAPEPYWHQRAVKWMAQDVPRSSFDQDILYSLGAFTSICQVKRNNAEERVRAMSQNGWKAQPLRATTPPHTKADDDDTDSDDSSQDRSLRLDLDEVAREEIAAHVLAKFKGYEMARLVEAILRAQGYTVHRPSEGPDHGIDLLAAPDNLGFGGPRICVQVKSQETPLDRPTLDQLIGTMSNVQADRGLLVCWGGFKSSVLREKSRLFFKVRFWDRDGLLMEIFRHYDKLPEEIRAEIPLKRTWMLALPEDEADG